MGNGGLIERSRRCCNGIFKVPQPANEPVFAYAPSSPERAALKATLQEMLDEQVDVPMIIAGKEVRNGKLADLSCPHDHHHVLGRYHQGDALYVEKAVEAANDTKAE